MSYGFIEDKFYIDLTPVARSVGSVREEFIERAKLINNSHNNLILSFSGGTDSQATYLAFHDAGIKVPCAFLHFLGYNDNELENTKACQKRFGFDLQIVDIDPIAKKDDVLQHSNALKIPPNQILHALFLQKLPEKTTLVEGFNGPDPYVHKGKHYILETANSVEYARLRAHKTLNKARTAVGFEKDEHLLLSILKDGILTSVCESWDYYNIEGLSYLGEEPISIINYWDLFIKPVFYGKNFGKDLIYFPKYQGCEKIDYIINGMEHDYRSNQIFLNVQDTIDFLENGSATKRYWQRNPSL